MCREMLQVMQRADSQEMVAPLLAIVAAEMGQNGLDEGVLAANLQGSVALIDTYLEDKALLEEEQDAEEVERPPPELAGGE